MTLVAHVHGERRIDLPRRDRFEDARLELAKRLRPLCLHMPQSEFDELTARMTRIKEKYTAITAFLDE